MTNRVMIMVLMLLLSACGSAESVLLYEEVPKTGDPTNGEVLFNESVNRMPACSGCHVAAAAGAPSLAGYAAVAGERVEGQDAREYTFYAIAEPAQHIVEGYGNAMYANYDNNLTPQQIADLIAYMLADAGT
jgi:mono/diheme cytochrome c family protein